MVPNASLYDFGILTSNVHMAWMRTVAGRMKSDYSYSNTVVYNNFPIPEFTDKQKEKSAILLKLFWMLEIFIQIQVLQTYMTS